VASRSLVSSEEIAGPFAVSLEWKPMHIKKLTNSSVLKRGESLIVLKCSKRYPDDVLIDLRKSLGSKIHSILSPSPGTGSLGQPLEKWEMVQTPKNDQ
jgi:hypothetical protein